MFLSSSENYFLFICSNHFNFAGHSFDRQYLKGLLPFLITKTTGNLQSLHVSFVGFIRAFGGREKVVLHFGYPEHAAKNPYLLLFMTKSLEQFGQFPIIDSCFCVSLVAFKSSFPIFSSFFLNSLDIFIKISFASSRTCSFFFLPSWICSISFSKCLVNCSEIKSGTYFSKVFETDRPKLVT